MLLSMFCLFKIFQLTLVTKKNLFFILCTCSVKVNKCILTCTNSTGDASIRLIQHSYHILEGVILHDEYFHI